MIGRPTQPRTRTPVGRIEGEVGEIQAFTTAIRYMTESSGDMDVDDKAAVYTLACFIHERVELIRALIAADSGEQPHA